MPGGLRTLRGLIPRDRTTFARWAAQVGRALGPELPWAPEQAWERAERNIAARIALAAVREQLCDGAIGRDTLRIDGLGELPLAAHGDFGLHRLCVTAWTPPTLATAQPLWAWLARSLRVDADTTRRVADELADSTFNLALAILAAEARPQWARQNPTDPRATDPEHWVTEGHPWHPMTKTRLGLGLREHALVAPELWAHTPLRALDIDASLVQVTDAFVDRMEPWLGRPARGSVRVPVHGFQVRRLARLFADRWGTTIRPAPWRASGRSLLSLRTIATTAPETGPLHLKLALDVHTTSARRVVSAMSVTNGPRVSTLLRKIQQQDPICARLRIAQEQMTAGLRTDAVGPDARELGVIVRDGTAFEAADGSVAWVCAGLGERHPILGVPLIAQLASGFEGTPRERAEAMLTAYLDTLIPPVLRFAVVYGVALEMHLQNTLVAPDHGRPAQFIVRDLGGIRIHGPRLRSAGHDISLHPDSFIITDDLAELQTKASHTLLHAHLTAVFGWTEDALGLPRTAAWQLARRCIVEHLERWARQEPYLAGACHADRAALLTPSVRAKALFRMRVDDRSSDYSYVDVENPLAQR